MLKKVFVYSSIVASVWVVVNMLGWQCGEVAFLNFICVIILLLYFYQLYICASFNYSLWDRIKFYLLTGINNCPFSFRIEQNIGPFSGVLASDDN